VTLSSVAKADATAETDGATAETDAEGEPIVTQVAPGGGSVSQPISPNRDGEFSLTLDLRDLGEDQGSELAIPEPGGAVNLVGEVTDRYDLDGRVHRVTSQLFRLEIVTPENLLALLERRELALRSRLEQTIEETRQLRDSLSGLKPDLETLSPAGVGSEEPAAEEPTTEASLETTDASLEPTGESEAEAGPERERQILRLRTQQIGLQATKTGEELEGIAASLDDLLEEMANNRIDSVDRSERIGGGVRDPLRAIVAGDLAKLKRQIAEIEAWVAGRPDTMAAEDRAGGSASADADADSAVQTAEDVLLQLTAVLEKMLDLESFNEVLDMVRELIESQDGLIDETKKEQKRRVLDLFE
jgi:hypothetical protein